jgi:hypothetical protein
MKFVLLGFLVGLFLFFLLPILVYAAGEWRNSR